MPYLTGWLKLYRAVFDNPIVTQSPEHMTIWLYLLTHATPRPYKTIFGGREIELQAGQLITSRNSIAACVNSRISDSKVQRVLKAFENAHQIEQQTSNKNRLVTLINWDLYQLGEQQIEQRMNIKRTTSEHQANTNGEIKNIEKEKKKNSLRACARADGEEKNIFPFMVESTSSETERRLILD